MQQLANGLTLLRIMITPFIIFALVQGSSEGAWVALALFSVAAITDYVDGWCARRFGSTPSGTMLDPIADKLLVASVILALTARGLFPGLWLFVPFVIISRELFVAGLREYLGQQHVKVPVTYVAKIKTALQLAALGLAIGALIYPLLSPIAYTALLTAALLTLYTGWQYAHAFFRS